MGIALALLLGTIIVAWLAPRALARWQRRQADPLVLMVSWALAVSGVVATGVVGIALLFVPDHGVPGRLVVAMRGCWMALRHGWAPNSEALAGLVGIAALVVMTARFVLVGLRQARRRERARQQRSRLLRIAGRVEDGSPQTVWLDHDRPLAFSLGGRPGLVVATEGLKRHLAPAQVAAVLAHERAHLRGRHHALLAIAEALAVSLPFVPLFRRAPGSVRELIEASADAAAARVHGRQVLRSALLRVAGHDAPIGALAIARDAVQSRLARLASPDSTPGRARRTLAAGTAGVVSVVFPAATAAGLLLASVALFCPLG